MDILTRSQLAVLASRVSSPAGAPSFVSVTPPTAYYGAVYTYPFTANNADTITFEDGALPAGSAISSVGVLTVPTKITRDANGAYVYPPNSLRGSYTFRVRATNSNSGQFVISDPITLTVQVLASIIGGAVEGIPASYFIHGTDANVVSQQWYRISSDPAATGPQIITGATAATYTPTSADGSYFLAVACLMSDGTTIWSLVFQKKGTQLWRNAGLQMANPAVNQLTSYASNSTGSFTAYIPQLMRLISGTSYTETLVAPGAYTFAAIGQSVQSFFSGPDAISPPAIGAKGYIPAVTATRPSANTGTGHFVANGALYAPSGAKVQVRGINHLHYDQGISDGFVNAKPNMARFWLDSKSSWSTYNGPAITKLVANKIIPMLTLGNTWADFVASFDGSDTMTVTGTNHGHLYIGMPVPVPGVTGLKVLGQLTVTGTSGSGLTGTYQVSSPVAAATGVAMTIGETASGLSNPFALDSVVKTWITEVWPNLTAVADKVVINVMNEALNAPGTFSPRGYVAGTTLDITSSVGAVSHPVYLGQWLSAPDGTVFQVLSVSYTTTTTGTAVIDRSLNIATSSAPVAFGDVTWREAYKKAVTDFRTAGVTCPIAIDSGGSGQDMVVHQNGNSTDVFNADPIENTLFTPHAYWKYPGQASGYIQQMNTLMQSVGCAFIVGELGPGRGQDVQNVCFMDPHECMYFAWANDVGVIYWCWDDNNISAGVTSNDYWYAMVTANFTGYNTSNDADLTMFGKVGVKDAYMGTLASVPSAVFN